MGGWVVCTTGPEEVNAQAVSRGRHEVSKDPATPPPSYPASQPASNPPCQPETAQHPEGPNAKQQSHM